jgi:predicted enzyme related to lactoylglutathione lyase
VQEIKFFTSLFSWKTNIFIPKPSIRYCLSFFQTIDMFTGGAMKKRAHKDNNDNFLCHGRRRIG